MINGGYDHEKGNNIIKESNADLVAYGQLYISNPDLVERFENNLELAAWHEDTFYTTGANGYTDYPKASHFAKI